MAQIATVEMRPLTPVEPPEVFPFGEFAVIAGWLFFGLAIILQCTGHTPATPPAMFLTMANVASHASEDAVTPRAPKRFDVFISHHHGAGLMEDEQQESGDFSQQFASWIWAICESLSLSARFDATNLSRILDERKLKNEIVSSRVLVGIVNRSALLDHHGMYQELQWAEAANVPIVPFYNGDVHSPEEYSSWSVQFPVLKRAPVVYHRRSHLRVKDSLILALEEALHDSYKAGDMPLALSNLLQRQVEGAQRRQRRAERVAETGSSEERGDAVDKRFRFRDDDLEEASPGGGGMGRLLKTLKDPMGWKEQEMRTAMLQDEHEIDDEQGKHVPKHSSLKPSGSILKGGTDVGASHIQSVSATSHVPGDPKMQQGVVRVKEYLESVDQDDVAQLPSILKILQLMQPHLEVVSSALELTFEFTRGAARCRQIVAQNDGIKAIVSTMSAHPGSMTLQMHGCGCLYALCCFRAGSPDKDNNSVGIAQAGGIARILFATWTLITTSFSPIFYNRPGVTALPRRLIPFPNAKNYNSGGAVLCDIWRWRLVTIAGKSFKMERRGINRRMITKSGGIELLVRCMASFPHDLEIQENGCAALCNLVVNRHDTKVRAARSGCIRAIVNSMKNFPFEPEVTQMACAVLRSLALGVPENKVSIVAQGGVRQLCEAMARHRTDADVNMQAIAALCNLTSHFAEHKRAICEAGGLELTVAALLLHPQHEELQQQGVGLLHNLACEVSLRKDLLAAGALRVAEAAQMHPARLVQSLGHMLQRQMSQAKEAQEAEKDVSNSLAKTDQWKEAKEEPGEGGVDELFAPRSRGVRVARSKALTRPQRKVMADVMASMQRHPHEWLPRDGSSASDLGGSSEASSGRSVRGKWNIKEQKKAAAYGIEDLEGASDSSLGSSDSNANPGSFAFLVRRGLAKQAREDEGEENHSSPASPKPRSGSLPLTARNVKAQEQSQESATDPPPLQTEHIPQKDGRDQVAEIVLDAPIQSQAHEDRIETESVISDASEGDWIDDLEDPRLGKRMQRQRGKLQPSSESSFILDGMLGAVELEQVAAPQTALPKLGKKNVEFARALKKCGEVAPERFDELWQEALSRKVSKSGRSSSSVMNELDGVSRFGRMSSAMRSGLKDVKSLAILRRDAPATKDIAGSEGASGTGSEAGQEVRDDLQKAEIALLDALGQFRKQGDASGMQSADEAMRHPSREALRLEALSRQLEQKRALQRRVQLL
ncbi:Protein aardvark (Suppressor of amiB protein 16) [Durusdinium trenchii]|uniref:Protein aardvark (Suppressor of amiB protein 16) n=1 Tax=Durusdinium trenchii TaxID=1381693 RepID=A0ABP0M2H7_9DINO